MIAGHFGIAYIARSIRRDAPLLPLLAAALLPDALDGIYALAGICSPFGLYSHSLPAIGAIALIAAAVASAFTRRWEIAVAVAVVVLLHAPADWITGEKILWAGGPRVDGNLYRWPWADFLLEAPMVTLGWMLLRKSGAGPKWATTRTALAALLLAQALGDSTVVLTRRIGTEGHRRACSGQAPLAG